MTLCLHGVNLRLISCLKFYFNLITSLFLSWLKFRYSLPVQWLSVWPDASFCCSTMPGKFKWFFSLFICVHILGTSFHFLGLLLLKLMGVAHCWCVLIWLLSYGIWGEEENLNVTTLPYWCCSISVPCEKKAKSVTPEQSGMICCHLTSFQVTSP